ncbi:MAG: acetyl-CoA carboxylase biotin carboxyl carrier protein [Peptostreptococcaceae bacterium]
MNLNEIKELLLVIDKTNLESVTLESSELKLQVLKNTNRVEKKETLIESYDENIKSIIDLDSSFDLENVSTNEDELYVVTSPLMGTFYQAPSPETENFVKVGDVIEKGETLCIIEAMKLMNEINSDVRGRVVEINANNEDLVEYSQPLFKIKPL